MSARPPLRFCCGECGSEQPTPDALLTHMMATGHGLSPEVHWGLQDSGDYAELLQALKDLAENPEMGEPVSEEEFEELPEEVKERFERVRKREKERDGGE